MNKQTKLKVYKQLTEPRYKTTREEPVEVVLKDIEAMCTQLRLGQRSVSILGLSKDIKKELINDIIKKTNNIVKDYNDDKNIKYKFLRIKEYNFLILFKEDLYLKLFDEVCSKKKYLSPYLFHYIFTQLFGYSDRAYKLFLDKWVNK